MTNHRCFYSFHIQNDFELVALMVGLYHPFSYYPFSPRPWRFRSFFRWCTLPVLQDQWKRFFREGGEGNFFIETQKIRYNERQQKFPDNCKMSDFGGWKSRESLPLKHFGSDDEIENPRDVFKVNAQKTVVVDFIDLPDRFRGERKPEGEWLWIMIPTQGARWAVENDPSRSRKAFDRPVCDVFWFREFLGKNNEQWVRG